ncbi:MULTISPECIES: ABC transporter substrate-binding protein [unclassified Breznakia]|uniref:ABC transporter substrate-binding protein n=1 Tax=unclassified Breznakia TaxID=2623764 RepID=UPI002475A81B|nr:MULTISPECIES: ABC transporter substrate-binding protein [unclassified Breznakia]MDH6367581.1 peptide/nickel transport system substrate-binding protein [Breznakia sp. PH1-1]MDH6404701.1 peptide/nickel transport system substrate-binding protein [Breznakia sp. PF1-11]MDH6412411.1 peptide/nickel transport system substrate-binding protein [Breznakia sp. PFB1-11]MDH6414776.1 peptide/nickel transport system substrate-binding protein [Breznakia sp. PFB1-14]MDH6417082.1 peptide/nickel transport syst
MKKVLTLLSCFAMMITLVACGGSSSESSDTFVMGAEKLTGTFSPLYYASSYDGYVVDLAYDSLMDYDKDDVLVPELAKEEPTISEDGKTITFKLQKDIKFSNGDPLTADDVAFTFQVLADPSYDGRYSAKVLYLEGLDAYRGVMNPDTKKYEGGSGKLEDFTGIKVVSDTEVQFTFTEARSDNLLTVAKQAIVNAEDFADYAFGDVKAVKDAMGEPNGTGPYVMKSWDAATGAVFEKSESYWGEGFEIAKVIIKPVEMTTDWTELKNKSVDMLAGMIEPKKVGPASATDFVEFSIYPRAGMGYVEMNTVSGVTSDVAVRKAMMYGFDRQAFVDSYYECPECEGIDGVGAYVPQMYANPGSIMGDIVRGTEEIEGLDGFAYDLDKANQVLDEAGWVRGADGIRVKDGQRLEIKALTMKDHDILSNIIPMWQKNWGEMGADVKIATVDFNTLLDKVYSDDALEEWNIFFMATSWTTTEVDVFSSFHSSEAKNGGDNLSRINDPELDALLDEALRTLDEDAQKEVYNKIAVKLGELCVKVPVYGNTYFDMYNGEKIEGFKTNTFYNWTAALKDAKMK